MDESFTFGAWLRAKRRSADLTQAELARRVGSAAVTICKLESGRLRPSKETVKLLAAQFGVQPSEQDFLVRLARHRNLKDDAGSHSDLLRVPAIPSELHEHVDRASRFNVPVPLTSFIGRERELAETARQLGATRLLTLTGSGGCGKTRLAQRLALEVQNHFPDGIWFVSLAPLTDPVLVPRYVATGLGLREQPDRALQATLVDFLEPKRALLVLDNCDHLIDACARLVDVLLQACPGVRILATSREALGVGGEIGWRVPSLDVPPLDRALPTEELAGFEAVRLFVDRARAVRSSFMVTPENGPVIAQICARVDGLPLAIELAAARVNALSVEAIVARLDDRFRLLTRGSRMALPRQQSLRATIDWSYNLLTDAERLLFRRLAVFVGGWSLEAAERVGSGGAIEELSVLDLLAALIEKSLVQVDERGDTTRYTMLETLRQYASDRLFEADEATTARDRHRDWCLALGEAAEPELRGPRQLLWFDRLEGDHENLRAALEWCRESDPRLGLRLAESLWWFWFVRGYFAEGRHWFEGLLARVASDADCYGRTYVGLAWLAFGQLDLDSVKAFSPEALRRSSASENQLDLTLALYMAPGVALWQGEPAGARERAEEGMRHAGTSGPVWERGLALVALAWVADAIDDDKDRARSRLEESLTHFRQSGDRWGIAVTVGYLGDLAASLGDYDRARVLLEERLALTRLIGDTRLMEEAIFMLGLIARTTGDYSRASTFLEEALRLARDRSRFAPAGLLAALGDLARVLGDCTRARLLLAEGLVLARDSGNTSLIKSCLGFQGQLAMHQKNYRRAARLLGAAAKGEPDRGGVFRHEWIELQAAVATVRDAMGDDDFTIARAEGQRMTLDQAIAYALSEEITG